MTTCGISDGCLAGLDTPGTQQPQPLLCSLGPLGCVLCPSSAPWRELQAPGPCFFCMSRRMRNSLKTQKPQEVRKWEFSHYFRSWGFKK